MWKRPLDYQSVGRKTFLVETLPDSMLPFNEPEVSSLLMSDDDMVEVVRSFVRNKSEELRRIPVDRSECGKIRRILLTGMDFPEVTVEISQNFDGVEYFVIMYKGKDIFGELV